MNKIVLMKGQDSFVDHSISEVEDVYKRATERFEFMKNRMLKMMEEATDEKRKFWTSIENHLKASNKLPLGYDPEKHFLEWDHENQMLWVKEKRDSMEDLMKKLMPGLF